MAARRHCAGLPVIEVLQKEEHKMKIFRMSRMFWKLFPSLGLMTLFLMATSAWANGDPPVPFECTGDAYTVRTSHAELFRIDQSVMPFVFDQIGTVLQGPFGTGGALIDIQANNLGYDTIENILWAVAMPVSGNFNYGIIRIDSTGKVFPVASALPSNTRYLAGDISTDGNFLYANTYGTSANMQVVDLDLVIVTQLPLTGGPVNVADWAYNPIDGKLYGAVGRGSTNTTGAKVYRLDPDTGVISLVGAPPGLPLASGGDEQYYGGAWFDQFGHLFLYRNSDFIYEIDLSGPVIVEEFAGGAGTSQFNDAAACAAENPTVNKFYTHTNNDWSDRCVSYLIVENIETDICETYRLPNTYLDADIFANPLDQINEEFVLFGKEGKKKTVVTPGQYFAVVNIGVLSTQDVWVQEDFSDCADIGSVNPFKVPGGVQVVIVDANGDVHDIDDDLALGIGGSIVLTPDDVMVHVEDVPAGSTLRVMVKFEPSNDLDIIGKPCTNMVILYEEICDAEATPECELVEINKEASAVLTIVESP
jgi:hypothetical protein